MCLEKAMVWLGPQKLSKKLILLSF
jgi:hypothetical protein